MIDLGSPHGRLVADIMAAVAAFETELRGERVKAGQKVARDAGKTWGGSEKGRRTKVTAEQVDQVISLKARGMGVTSIARATGVSRRHVYQILSDVSAA